MAVAEFRFYEELNDFLARDRRKRTFRYRCARQATVKQAIESLGTHSHRLQHVVDLWPTSMHDHGMKAHVLH